MATTQELLAKAQSQAAALKVSQAQVNREGFTVPVNAIESAQPPLNLPQQTIEAGSSIDVAEATAASNDLLTAENKARQDVVTQAQDRTTQSERDLQSLFRAQGQESVDRARLEEQIGVDDIQRNLLESTLQLRQGAAGLRSFDLETTDLREQSRLEAGGRDISKGVFGAKNREFTLQRAIQRSHKSSDLESLAAVASYQRGDLALAQSQADKALASIYDPIDAAIENQKFFYNNFRQDLSAAQKAAGDTQMAIIERQQSAQDSARLLANQAVASGVASPQEVRDVTNPNLTPEERSTLANSILARGSEEDRSLALQLRNAQIRSQNRANQKKMDTFDPKRQLDLIKLANMGDPVAIGTLGYDPRELGSAEKLAKVESDTASNNLFLEAAQGLLDNDKGLQASSGDIQSPLLSGFAKGGEGILGQLPIIGNIRGSLEAKHAKQTFLSEVGFLINNQTFDKLVSLKQGGATFGALSDSERVAIGKAATKLAASAEVDEAGSVTGFNVPEDVLRGYVSEVLKGYEASGEQIIIDSMPNSDKEEAANIWNQ